jgi:hypothetical protein
MRKPINVTFADGRELMSAECLTSEAYAISPTHVEQAFAQVVRRGSEPCRSDAGGRFQHPLTDV